MWNIILWRHLFSANYFNHFLGYSGKIFSSKVKINCLWLRCTFNIARSVGVRQIIFLFKLAIMIYNYENKTNDIWLHLSNDNRRIFSYTFDVCNFVDKFCMMHFIDELNFNSCWLYLTSFDILHFIK